MNFVINEIELLKFEGLTSKSDTIDTNIQINRKNLVFSYTDSPQVKVSQ